MLEFKNNNNGTIYLISNDSGPRIKAKSREIEVIQIPESLELDPDRDPTAKEIERLRAENETHKNRIPQLKLHFQDGNNYSAIEMTPLQNESIDEKLIDDEMKKLKDEYPHIPLSTRNKTSVIHRLSQRMENKKIINYNKSLDKYFGDYLKYLYKLFEHKQQESLSFKLKLVLINQGNLPAKNIDIFISFPDYIHLHHPDEMDPWPVEPSPPKNQIYGDGSENISFMNQFESDIVVPSDLSLPNPDKPVINKSKGRVEYSYQSLKHKLKHDLVPIIVTFKTKQDVKNFSVSYEISESNIPDIVKGNLSFKIADNLKSPRPNFS